MDWFQKNRKIIWISLIGYFIVSVLYIIIFLRIKLARYILPEPKEASVASVKEDYPLFVDTREDALRLLKMTENGAEQVGGSVVFE